MPKLKRIDEDCLFLNVWTPRLAFDARLPVLVWIHGGSNLNGFAYEPNYLGQNLSRRGVVVVSIAYRLGVLGFLAHPTLTAEAPDGRSGDYGLLDQVAALRWIRAHIAAFGGDPANVTLFGESAGGGDIAALLREPEAKGLFNRAIIESGALGPGSSRDVASAEAAGATFMSALGARTADEMRAIPASRLVEAWRDQFKGAYLGAVQSKAPPAKSQPVPLLIGTNTDEDLMYTPAKVENAYGAALAVERPHARAIAAWLARRYGTRRQRLAKLETAQDFLCPALRLASQVHAAGAPVYVYLFNRVRRGGDQIGAYHGAEIPYVFDTADAWLPHDHFDDRLADALGNYWAAFARSGSPNAPEEPRWPRFKPPAKDVLTLGDQIVPSSPELAPLCALLVNQ